MTTPFSFRKMSHIYRHNCNFSNISQRAQSFREGEEEGEEDDEKRKKKEEE